MKKFEHKMVIGNTVERILDDQTTLSYLGDDGWELVAVVYPVKPRNEGIGARSALYYLKKEITDSN